MIESQLTIQNDEGLHARPAGILAKTAAEFKSKIELVHNGKAANAKSLLSIMGLGLKKGSEFMVRAEGEDASGAIERINQLVANRFC